MKTLTSDEVKELTGYTQIKTQIRCLDAMGVPYRLDHHGKPRVLESAVLTAFDQPQKPSQEPDFSWMTNNL